MYGCESWTVKKAECWRIDAVELWCWRRLLRVSWNARRSNLSILKESSPGCSLEGLMLKLNSNTLATSCKVLTHWKRLMLGGIGGQKEKETIEDKIAGWHHWLDGHKFKWTPGVGDGQGGLACCDFGVAKSQTQLSYRIELNWEGIEGLEWKEIRNIRQCTEVGIDRSRRPPPDSQWEICFFSFSEFLIIGK